MLGLIFHTWFYSGCVFVFIYHGFFALFWQTSQHLYLEAHLRPLSPIAEDCHVVYKHNQLKTNATHDPRRVKFTNMTRDTSPASVTLIFSPSASRHPRWIFLLFSSVKCIVNSKYRHTRPHARPWRVKFMHMTHEASLVNHL